MTKENFLKGAAILGIAGFIVKILGAIYRIPLANMITDEGMGYYQTSYNLYSLLIVISTTGLTTAVAKLVSEKRAVGDYRGAHDVFRISFMGFLISGILTSVFLFFTSKSLVTLIKNTNAYYSMIALAPALLFVPIMSSFRGYLQGMQDMVPTAVSQIVEQLFRVIFGYGLAYYLLNKGLPMAAGGASFGASAGAIGGTIIIYIIYLIRKKHIKNDLRNTVNVQAESTVTIIKRLLSIAIPIMIGGAIVPIMNTIDNVLVLTRLQTIGFSEGQANDLYGQLGGMAQTLINLPQVFTIALGMSLIPAISDVYVKRNYDGIRRITQSGIRVTLLIGLPSALGLSILATPIIKLLYYNLAPAEQQSIGAVLQILAFSVLFLTLIQSLTAILQGLGKAIVPVKNLAIGAVVKIILTYILVGIRDINVRGAAISTVVAYMIAAIFNFAAVKKHTKTNFNIMNTFLKPIFSAILMAVSVWFSYSYLEAIVGGKGATVIAILIGVFVYGITLLITGTITSRDFELLPGGMKIAKILKTLRILRD